MAAPASASRSAARSRACSAANCGSKVAPGKGSTFTLVVPFEGPQAIALPRPPADDARPAADEELAPAAPTDFADDRDTIRPGDRVVLIVEDDETFGRILVEAARSAGLKGVLSSAGSGTLALARKLMPDAITLDLGLSDIDGWVLFDLLRHDPKTRSHSHPRHLGSRSARCPGRQGGCQPPHQARLGRGAGAGVQADPVEQAAHAAQRAHRRRGSGPAARHGRCDPRRADRRDGDREASRPTPTSTPRVTTMQWSSPSGAPARRTSRSPPSWRIISATGASKLVVLRAQCRRGALPALQRTASSRPRRMSRTSPSSPRCWPKSCQASTITIRRTPSAADVRSRWCQGSHRR